MQNVTVSEFKGRKKASAIMLFIGYVICLWGGWIGLLIGVYYYNSKTKLPNGEKVKKYDERSRKHGMRMQIFGAIVMVVIVYYQYFTDPLL